MKLKTLLKTILTDAIDITVSIGEDRFFTYHYRGDKATYDEHGLGIYFRCDAFLDTTSLTDIPDDVLNRKVTYIDTFKDRIQIRIY